MEATPSSCQAATGGIVGLQKINCLKVNDDRGVHPPTAMMQTFPFLSPPPLMGSGGIIPGKKFVIKDA